MSYVLYFHYDIFGRNFQAQDFNRSRTLLRDLFFVNPSPSIPLPKGAREKRMFLPLKREGTIRHAEFISASQSNENFRFAQDDKSYLLYRL